MGGALALYYGYQKGLGLAGVFALSAFLNKDSRVYEVRTFKTYNSRDADLGHL